MLLHMFLILHLQMLVMASSSSSEEDGSSERDDEHSKGSSHQHQWGYHDQDTWSSAFEHCSGKSQSPIDIDTHKVFYDPRLPPIKLEGYDLTGSAALTLINNGHTLQLSLPSSMRIMRGFDHVYVAAQLHFHWGTTEVPGSEHTIDNVHFPAEIHVVHYNSKYANLTEAASKADGLAVLGGFIGIGLHENDNYEKILSALTDISIEESNTEIPGFNVRHLLPNSLERFYRYNGSLTTPPCFQTVSWTLFNDSIRVSRRQLAALEDTLKTEHNKLLSKNFRAPQLLHGRKVLASFHTVSSMGIQLSLPSSMRIMRGFDHVYVAAQLHFHWGTTEVPGSEHTIDNVHFPAEIHVVHYNSKYANLTEAASKADGLAVLGGFIGIGLHENDNYEKILSALTDISIEESNTEIPGFNVRHLLPNSLERFYRYNGSLTTPPCFQTVSWTLFNDSIRVSRRQLAALEDTLKTEHNKLLSKNFRAPQLLHGRKVLASFHTVSSMGKPREAPQPETQDNNVKKTSGGEWHILAITFGVLFAITFLVFSMYTYQQKKKYSKFKKGSKQNVIYKPASIGKDIDQTSVTIT
ncbi:hypothetical protein ABG768_002276 [Culter alburnus]|uniref:Carbonic anhydrase n=1 Tax=Culter alburnus TaxID=194366 RepID=A0AAW2A4V8_CULAL